MIQQWKRAQAWETGWWGDCTNTYGEEEKQWLYARKMLLGGRMYHNRKSPYNIDMDGRRVVDLGGGPTSLLLKCTGLERATVVDPLVVPDWVHMRYEAAEIEYIQGPAEAFSRPGQYDEAWIYNCLQHTQDPRKIIDNARKAAGIVRIFEWLGTKINEGHPHSFSAGLLDEWLEGEGKVSVLNGEANCYGKCYHGVFVGS